MIVRTINDIRGTRREVHAPTWVSRRLLLQSDGMGFSLHETVLYAGTETHMWYKNHLEAVYCVEGEGEIQDKSTGETHTIVPGTVYALNNHDNHLLRAKTNLRMICVFNPPCTGQEVHDSDGAYPLIVQELQTHSAQGRAAVGE
ncbi:MAG: L-ectoine synthase [Candidatus Hydrogenedentota bacterium]